LVSLAYFKAWYSGTAVPSGGESVRLI